MSNAREKILQTASELMEKQGYHGTGLNEIIQKSGAPKGSLYYYFPEGKEQLASEAILRAGQIVSERFRAKTADEPDPAKAIRDFLYMIAKRMEETKFYTGSTMTMIAMETVTESKRINTACQDGYAMLIGAFKDKLLLGGMEDSKASWQKKRDYSGSCLSRCGKISGGEQAGRTFGESLRSPCLASHAQRRHQR
jgi:TetR/AcrR family transcriptional regulator, lmrAB and yxaGH operons repressor